MGKFYTKINSHKAAGNVAFPYCGNQRLLENEENFMFKDLTCHNFKFEDWISKFRKLP